jgi:transposase-like protein
MVRQVLQTGLEVELADHLGYGPYEPSGRGPGNSRNGSYAKTVTTEIGDVELRVPRDRNATFEPVTVPKHQRRLDGLSGNVISLYAKGMTTGDIQAHLAEIYDTTISRDQGP